MEMERSVTSLTYKGSVSDAIVESQKQKKLFVVYISGEDENSTRLEQSTWVDDGVAESIAKYCIFLHLIRGSIDALQFSSIYPQKSVPSITAVGYNGVMLWQHEGYINVENFVGSIEKAWAALHFQETAVTLLTAALASKIPESLNSSSQAVIRGSSSASSIASTSSAKLTENLKNRGSDNSKLTVDQMGVEPVDDENTGPGPDSSSQSGFVADKKIKCEEQTCSEDITKGEVLRSQARDLRKPSTCNDTDISTAPKETVASDERCTTDSPVSMNIAAECDFEASEIISVANEETSKNVVVAEPIENTTKSVDIYLNIRLPNGASLQRKFILTDTLRSVKTYVDENQISSGESYDLAVPYPRKVFCEQDMNSVLSELGFAARQALMVVPHRKATRPQSDMSSFHDNQEAANMVDSTDDSSGYFAFVKRALSYMNPLSYLGGNASSSNSEPSASNDNQQQRAGTPNRPFGQNQQNPSSSNNTGEMRRTPRPFGSNIHTLRQDEDDFQSKDRNIFWNGNSTQFGGDDKK